MKPGIVAASLGLVLFCAVLLSFAKPAMCASGCGNLLEPVFSAAYYLFGPWGVRALLLSLSGLLFWVALRARA